LPLNELFGSAAVLWLVEFTYRSCMHLDYLTSSGQHLDKMYTQQGRAPFHVLGILCRLLIKSVSGISESVV
jgi:hypothetical protein